MNDAEGDGGHETVVIVKRGGSGPIAAAALIIALIAVLHYLELLPF